MKFKKGDTLRYQSRLRCEAEIRATGKVEAVPRKSGVELRMEFTWFVDRVDSGTATIAQKIDRVRLSYYKAHERAGRDEAAYDSHERFTLDNPWSALMDQALRPLLGKPAAVRIDDRAHIVDIKLPEEAKRAWEAMPWMTEGDQPYAPLFTEAGWNSLLACVLPGLPVGQVTKDVGRRNAWGGPPYQLQLTDTFTQPLAVDQSIRYTAITEATPSDPKAGPILSP